jgi:tetratricopeptide (TPR) repeat protein
VRFKPIYLYLIAIGAIIFGIIVFSNSATKNEMNIGNSEKMPNDSIHRQTPGSGDIPSGMNVSIEAKNQIENLRREYERNPADTLKAREYADFLTMAHQFEKALPIYHDILSQDSKRIDVLLQLTYIYFNNGELEKADLYTQKILVISKDHQLGLYNSGSIAATRGENQKAIKIWEGIIKKFPNTDIAKISEESIKQVSVSSPK